MIKVGLHLSLQFPRVSFLTPPFQYLLLLGLVSAAPRPDGPPVYTPRFRADVTYEGTPVFPDPPPGGYGPYKGPGAYPGPKPGGYNAPAPYTA